MSQDGVRLRSALRGAAFLAAGVLTVPVLAGCGSGEDSGKPAAQDIAPAGRAGLADGGTARWAVDAVPGTLNAFQSDADAATSRVAGAVLPAMFELDGRGRPKTDADYLESAKVVEKKPRQVVVYKLSQKAVWSNGREIGAADFAAQWHALSGKDTAYWTARNAGYDRIQKIERGADDLEVRVTFGKPYADWRSLFSPLYPKDVMGSPDAFNDGARRKLKVTAGPFAFDGVDEKSGEVALKRNPRWWGRPAKLSRIVLKAVPPGKRAAALAAGTVDIADVDTAEARRIEAASGGHGPQHPHPGASAASAASASAASAAADKGRQDADGKAEGDGGAGDHGASGAKPARGEAAAERAGLAKFDVRKSLEPAYTQLALNGSSGPLADERVRRAVARAIDRKALAKLVLRPLGLPAETVGSHLALAGQEGYTDGSGALGKQDKAEAEALLADAGWVRGKAPADSGTAGGKAGAEQEGKQEGKQKDQKDQKDQKGDEGQGGAGSGSGHEDASDGKGAPAKDGHAAERSADRSTDDKPGALPPARQQAQPAARPVVAPAEQAAFAAAGHPEAAPALGHAEHTGERAAAQDGPRHLTQGGAPGAYAPKGTAAPANAGPGALAKNGKPLTLRFVLPSGTGSESLRTVGERISRMLEKIGIRTEITKVADDSYFADHIASGQYDLALYSWPGSAFPATDARPIFAKPVPAADGSLNVEQNYTRVGTDHIDQLFDRAATELDGAKARDIMKKADARIWAEAGSIPLYQRPQLVAVRAGLANVGAFGFEAPRYEDIGFRK
ncbi:ABC transporter family substrate-binding protein [Streptomyces sp. NPDC050560]|uniref:ABC transporter family substrate-binding protein n=1 Tax=Streptomyces sp. NPDC050560 TaxID=3365630 RepID=UPI0037BD6B96